MVGYLLVCLEYTQEHITQSHRSHPKLHRAMVVTGSCGFLDGACRHSWDVPVSAPPNFCTSLGSPAEPSESESKTARSYTAQVWNLDPARSIHQSPPKQHPWMICKAKEVKVPPLPAASMGKGPFLAGTSPLPCIALGPGMQPWGGSCGLDSSNPGRFAT